MVVHTLFVELCTASQFVCLFVCCGTALYITGYKKEAAKLLDKFVWGHSFIELNHDLLEAYSRATSSEEVIKIQEQYISEAEADIEARKHDRKLTIDELMTMENPNHRGEDSEIEEEEEEDEGDDEEDDDEDEDEEEDEEEEEEEEDE